MYRFNVPLVGEMKILLEESRIRFQSRRLDDNKRSKGMERRRVFYGFQLHLSVKTSCVTSG